MFPNAPLGSFTAATRRSGSGRGRGRGRSYLQQQTNQTVSARPGRAGAADRCRHNGKEQRVLQTGEGARGEMAPDGAGRIQPRRAPFACLPRSIRLGGVGGSRTGYPHPAPGWAPGAGPGSLRHCTWRGERGAPSGRRDSPQGFSSRAQTCWGQPVRPFSFFSPWPKGCE